MKKDFNEICICLDNAIQNANGKLSLQTKIGTFVNLEKRENGRFKGTWWQYSRPQNLNEFDTLKIMTPEIANGCQIFSFYK